jgi:5'-methylthioadenosine nucleosidase
MHVVYACRKCLDCLVLCVAGFKEGVVSTGNSLDYTVECMTIMNEHGVAVKEMEAAAVAYVCSLWGTPMFAIKSITDLVDGEHATPEEFLRNLARATDALSDAVKRVVEYMRGKAIAEL